MGRGWEAPRTLQLPGKKPSSSPPRHTAGRWHGAGLQAGTGRFYPLLLTVEVQLPPAFPPPQLQASGLGRQTAAQHPPKAAAVRNQSAHGKEKAGGKGWWLLISQLPREGFYLWVRALLPLLLSGSLSSLPQITAHTWVGLLPSPNIWLSALSFGSGAPDGPQGQADATRPAPWWEPGGLFAKPAPAPCSIKGWSWLQRARKPLPTLLLLRLSRMRSSTPCSKPSTMPGCEPGGITPERAQAQGCNQIPVQAVQIPLGVLQSSQPVPTSQDSSAGLHPLG